MPSPDPTPAEWELAKRAFERALDLAGTERDRFVASPEHPEAVRSLVRSLLGARDAAPDFLADKPRVHAPGPALQVEPGAKIGAYRVLGLLAEGGMGAVYEAQQEQPSRTVALKVLRPGLTSHRSRHRFAIEVEVLGRLQHPGIAQIYEAGLWEQAGGLDVRPYFAMELVRGTGMAAHCAGLGLGPKVEILAQVCEAVAHAHQRGVVHRDLKPANILVDDAGRVKVLDFGVARSTDADLQSTLDTNEAQVVGTVPYMSPEQVAGDSAEIDVRSDVYSLGVLGYELLLGQRPYDLSNTTILGAARIIRDTEPSPPAAINPAVKGDLERILLKALAKEPDGRYGSAAELGADLRRYLNFEPVLAHRPSALYRARKFARRHRALVGATVGIVLALAAGMIATTTQMIRARRSEAQARERAQELQAMARTLLSFDDLFYSTLGTMERRREYIRRALDGLDTLAHSAEGDPVLTRDLARAYLQYAAVQGGPFQANTGDVDGALKSYRRAAALVESLIAGGDDDLANYQFAARARQRGALVLTDTDRIAEAVSTVHAAMAAQRWVLTRDPESLSAYGDIAFLYWRLIDCLQRAGRGPEVVAYAEEVWSFAETMPPVATLNGPNCSTVGSAIASLARAMTSADRPERALQLLDRAEPYFAASLALAPGVAWIELSALDTHRFRAEALEASRDPAGAAAEYAALFGRIRGFLGRHPLRNDALDLLGFTLTDSARVCASAGLFDRAVAEADESVSVLEPFARREPKSVPTLERHLNALSRSAEVRVARSKDPRTPIDVRRDDRRLALDRLNAASELVGRMRLLEGMPPDCERLGAGLPARIAECKDLLAKNDAPPP